MLFRCSAAPLLLAAALAACGSGDQGEDGSAGGVDADLALPDAGPVTTTETNSFTFFEGRFAEPSLLMEAGDLLIVELRSTPEAVYFDMHAHVNDETTYFAMEEDLEIRHEFIAPEDGQYFILVGNKSSADAIEVEMSVELEEGSVLQTWGF